MSKYLNIPLLAAVFAISGVTLAKAESNIEFTGLFESTLAVGTATSGVQSADTILTVEMGVDLSQKTRLTIIGRIRSDFADNLEPGKPSQHNRSNWSKRLLLGDHIDAELREAYVDMEIGSTFLRLGKQQVVWGQADGLKVLDVLNPQSFREFVLADFEDSRIPLWTLNAEIPIGNAFLQLLWIPDRTYDDIPAAGATYAFTSPLIVPQAPANVPVTLLPPERPDHFFKDSDVAMKLAAFVGGWDLSFNYAFHYVDKPVIRRELTANGIIVLPTYERTHLVGGTFSNVFGEFTLRGEVGYSTDMYFLSDDPLDDDGVVRSGELSYVLGLDFQGWRDWFISVQVFQSIVTNPVPGMVRDKVDTSMTLLLRRDFMNEVLTAEVLWIQSINHGDGLVQMSLEYELRSNVRLKLGADIFYGSSQGLFGQFDHNDRVTMAVEIGF